MVQIFSEGRLQGFPRHNFKGALTILKPLRPQILRVFAKEVNAIGTNINQVAHAANISRQAPESRIDFLLKKLDEVIAVLNRIQEE